MKLKKINTLHNLSGIEFGFLFQDFRLQLIPTVIHAEI